MNTPTIWIYYQKTAFISKIPSKIEIRGSKYLNYNGLYLFSPGLPFCFPVEILEYKVIPLLLELKHNELEILAPGKESKVNVRCLSADIQFFIW